MPAFFDLSKGDTSGVTFKVPAGIHKAAFSTSDWNRIKRDALMAAGWRFINAFLWRRFTDFARKSLGYRSKMESQWPKGMSKHQPLVDSGVFRERLLAGAHPEAAAAGKALFIRTPFAHPLRPQHAAVLQRLTAEELADLNAVIEEQIASDVMEAGRRGKSRTSMKLGLSPPLRSSIKAGLKDRTGARYRLLADRKRAA